MVLLGMRLTNQVQVSLLEQLLKVIIKHHFGQRRMQIQDILGLRFLESMAVMDLVMHFKFTLNILTANCSVSLHDSQEEIIAPQMLDQVRLDGVCVEIQILHLQEIRMIGEVELTYLITLLIFQQVQMQVVQINLL